MEAKNLVNASYAWKSILMGRDVIKRGATWRIGSGLSVNVWGENWLPTKHNPRIITPVVVGWEGAKEASRVQQPSQSSTQALKLLWNKIWALNVPNKVKTLIWRACKNSLPTKANLFRRKIIPDGRCEICKQEDEDIMHAFYRCPALQSLKNSIPAWNQGSLKQSTCFTDFIGFIFAGTANPTLFSLVLWNLGNRLNNLKLGKPTLPLDKVLEHSRERQLESHSSPMMSTKQRRMQTATWTPPQDNWYKINFDGVTFADDRSAGLGVVMLNKEGRVMASVSQKIPLPMTVIEVEVLAARRALELAVELGFDHIILERGF
ncbi:hypothetical protein SO802_019574 [Lithocarpus litseifolius]|uniref:Reverse transcriptase zinc-binding domain-containing protein n=1 Tax=Lithocarpus litseifolius TaxID=425828 RepID=A0AAW2CR96_9ROSI